MEIWERNKHLKEKKKIPTPPPSSSTLSTSLFKPSPLFLCQDERPGREGGGHNHKLSLLFVLTFIVEAVDPVDAGALVVAPEQEEVLWVLDLVGEQEADGLQRLLAAVNVVPEEEVVGLGREAAVLEEPQEVVVLAVDVAADLERRLQLQEDGLGQEDLPRLEAEAADLVLRQLHVLAGAGPADWEAEKKNHELGFEMVSGD